jgi:hypothetical protein
MQVDNEQIPQYSEINSILEKAWNLKTLRTKITL